MMRHAIFKRFLLLFTFFLCTLTGFGAPKLKVKAASVVTVGETFQISYTIDASPDKFFPPSFSDFSVLAGPARSTSVSIINGSRTDHATFTYYVEATKEGVFNVPHAEVVVGGSSIRSEAFSIEVISAGSSPSTGKPSAGTGGSSGTATAEPATSTSAGELFARTEVSKTNLYKGEAAVATIRIYTQVGIADLTDFKVPQLAGLYSLDMDLAQGENSLKRINLNGKIYQSAVLKRYVFFPQRAGTIEIEPAEMTLSVQIPRAPTAGQTMFDAFFAAPHEMRQQILRTPKVVLNVKELPAGAPASFTGAVGSDFKIDAKIDKKEVMANQAIAFSLEVSGTGNLKLVDKPSLNFPPDFEQYDPKTNENLRTTLQGSVGSKKYEFALIPRSAGTFAIPGSEFTYFNPAQAKYVTLKSADLEITVTKDPNGNSAQTATILPPNQQDIKHLGRDILFIKTAPQQFHPRAAIFFGSGSFWLIALLLIVIMGVVLVVMNKRSIDARDQSKMRNKKANKTAILRLRQAKKLLDAGDNKLFYEEVSKGIWGYMSDKFDIPVAELSRDTVQGTLSSRDVSLEIIDALIKVIDECEYARYAPGSNQQTMTHIYDEAVEVISQLEK